VHWELTFKCPHHREISETTKKIAVTETTFIVSFKLLEGYSLTVNRQICTDPTKRKEKQKKKKYCWE
jgi:hypothetical protein